MYACVAHYESVNYENRSEYYSFFKPDVSIIVNYIELSIRHSELVHEPKLGKFHRFSWIGNT